LIITVCCSTSWLRMERPQLTSLLSTLFQRPCASFAIARCHMPSFVRSLPGLSEWAVASSHDPPVPVTSRHAEWAHSNRGLFLFCLLWPNLTHPVIGCIALVPIGLKHWQLACQPRPWGLATRQAALQGGPSSVCAHGLLG
jgi:hypothetical protein